MCAGAGKGGQSVGVGVDVALAVAMCVCVCVCCCLAGVFGVDVNHFQRAQLLPTAGWLRNLCKCLRCSHC